MTYSVNAATLQVDHPTPSSSRKDTWVAQTFITTAITKLGVWPRLLNATTRQITVVSGSGAQICPVYPKSPICLGDTGYWWHLRMARPQAGQCWGRVRMATQTHLMVLLLWRASEPVTGRAKDIHEITIQTSGFISCYIIEPN